MSQQAFANKELKSWFGKDESELDIVATYSLIYNASLMAAAGVGYLLSLDRILNLTAESELIFRPLAPPCRCRTFFIWKAGQMFSKAAALLKERIVSRGGGEGLGEGSATKSPCDCRSVPFAPITR